MKIYIDGKFYEKDKAAISVFDHGLLYGDGVFEGIRSYNCLVFRLKQHLDRLYESAHTIMLEISMTKDTLTEVLIKTLKLNKLRDAYIRLVVTRGTGDLGLDPRKCKRPTVFIITDKIALYPAEFYKNGLAIVTVPTQRNIPEALNPQVKSLNYLNNILAKIEAINAGVEEAIMLNEAGYVTECTGDNIFIVKGNKLITPPVYLGALRGITRTAVIELARRASIEVFEDVLTRHDLFNSDECFLTGTAAEIIPVVKIDGRKIAQARPGRVTARLMSDFHKLTKVDGVRYAL